MTLTPVKIENIFSYENFVEKDTYILYPTGGYHFFKDVPHAKEKYKLPIWPYLKRLKNLKRGHNGIFTPGVSVNNWYPYIKLEGKEKRKNSNKHETRKVVIHKLVSFAFIPNPNIITKTMVNHKNNDKTDYRVENLEWLSAKENSIGTPKARIKTPEEVYQMYILISKGIVDEQY